MTRSWREAVTVYAHPRVIGMLFLGFSAGLPLFLVGGTFSIWLRDVGIELVTIGFLSWVGIAHSIKVLWAPVVDRLNLPVLTRLLGRRRAWMLLSQVTIAVALAGMALTDPREHLMLIAVFAVMAAFGSATQDIAVDAYRIEAVEKHKQAAMATTYVYGYRVAMISAGTGAIYVASFASWDLAYGLMAVLMSVGMLTTLIIREPDVHVDRATLSMEQGVIDYLATTTHIGLRRDLTVLFIGAIVGPFVDFFKRYGAPALLILLFIGTFRMSDIFMGVMAQPFYLDLGFTKTQIANISFAFGLGMTLAGAALGGVLVMRFGIMPMLMFTAVMAPVTNLTFSWLAQLGPETYGLIIAIVADNVTAGMAIPVLIAYMSSLTNPAYTATQYALFSSLMTLPGQFFGGFTGWLAESVGWFWFFICSAGIGLPAIILAVMIACVANPDRIDQPGRG
ncbi:MAG: AmpG family muropeptide MFS transporter [Xanthomonadaceae bacterium]|nr:AmpG family muropeptide MFS transporter [Xanthomonadaceae bacterium]